MEPKIFRIVCVFLALALLGTIVWRRKKNEGQDCPDLIEYVLMAGFVAVAAGAMVPRVPADIRQVFSKILSM